MRECLGLHSNRNQLDLLYRPMRVNRIFENMSIIVPLLLNKFIDG